MPWSADEDHPDAWKDFVELAKASNVSFVTMNHVALDKEDVDLLTNRLQEIEYMDEDDMEEAGWCAALLARLAISSLAFPARA